METTTRRDRRWKNLRTSKARIKVLCDQLGQSSRKLGITGTGIWLQVPDWEEPVAKVLAEEIPRGPIGDKDFVRIAGVYAQIHEILYGEDA